MWTFIRNFFAGLFNSKPAVPSPTPIAPPAQNIAPAPRLATISAPPTSPPSTAGVPTTSTVGPDGKPQVIYDGPADPAKVALFVEKARAQLGTYSFTVVNSKGEPLDNRGNPIVVIQDPNGAQNSAGPIAFTKLFDKGRFTFKAGVPVPTTITAPKAGAYVLQFSGRGGVPGEGTDSTAKVKVTVTNARTTVTGDEGRYARIVAQAGEQFSVSMVSDKDTEEDVTLNVG